MREILFRGKRIDNGEWVMGNLFIPDKPDTPTQICIGTNIIRITYDVIPETVGEYTGLTDKNGKKIFEGDIVHLYGGKDTSTRFINYIALVIFAHGGFCAIDGTPDDYAVCRFDFASSHNCKIIGNIYDNPELIEDGDADEKP